ncbi:TenA family transcriptional regulator [Celerinatantimonas sp. YJH-8]|uniref:TenA family transcriptional regulator n=1 Tax=Celerinatantimonas sp. YJH-8 TaxID=3228714 RepID=UPI0038C03E05
MSLFFTILKQETQKAREQMLQAPILAACQQGLINKESYRQFLTQAYHHVKHTVPLLMACGGRLSEEYEWLRQAIGEYIEEESGHHEWILDDIAALGANAQMVRDNQGEGRVGWPIELMVAYLYHQIDRHNPLALFGMVWVLEGTSVSIGGNMAELIRHRLDLPEAAMSYLTSHSTLDQEHIQLFERLMNRVESPLDQQVIIDSANRVFHLYGEMLRQLPVASSSLNEPVGISHAVSA